MLLFSLFCEIYFCFVLYVSHTNYYLAITNTQQHISRISYHIRTLQSIKSKHSQTVAQ